MKSHEHFRPFDKHSSEMGAPVGLIAPGHSVEIVKYGDNKIFGIMTDPNGQQSCEFWQFDGGYGYAGADTLRLVMLPLGYCEGKPVFVGDELIAHNGGKKYIVNAHSTMDYFENACSWPSPEPKYPESKVLMCELNKANSEGGMRNVANMVVRRSIQDGDVFTKAQVTAVIEEMRKICDRQINPYNIREIVDGTDWDSILKAGL